MLPFRIRDYVIVQFCFDILLVVSLIIIGINLWRVIRISKKNPNALKKFQTFADMINEGDRFHKEKDNSGSVRLKSEGQNMPSNEVKGRRKKKGHGVQPASLQQHTPQQYKKVHELAELGMDRLAISQQSNVPIGEVNLILDLSKARSQSKPT